MSRSLQIKRKAQRQLAAMEVGVPFGMPRTMASQMDLLGDETRVLQYPVIVTSDDTPPMLSYEDPENLTFMLDLDDLDGEHPLG